MLIPSVEVLVLMHNIKDISTCLNIFSLTKKGNQGAPNSSTATLSVFQQINPWIQYQNVGST
jgi:hypothetical protein